MFEFYLKLARDPHTDPKVLGDLIHLNLSKGKEFQIMLAIALNPNTSKESLKVLSNVNFYMVRFHVCRHPKVTKEIIQFVILKNIEWGYGSTFPYLNSPLAENNAELSEELYIFERAARLSIFYEKDN